MTLVSHAEGALPTWTLEAIGPPVETQRRRFVRLEVIIEFRLPLLEGAAPAIAHTVDLSEGGIKCVVDNWAPDPGGRRFITELPIKERTLFIPSYVSWWGNLEGPAQRPVGIAFAEPERQLTDAIRAYVFEAQLDQRRKSRQ